MPKRYRRRKRRGRRSFVRKRRKRGMKTLLGNKLFCKLRLFDITEINPGVGLVANHVYSCNGLFAPNITGGALQPRGFDQIAPMFDHYTVVGAKIRVLFSTASGNGPLICGVHLKDTSSTSTSLLNAMESRSVKSRVLTLEKPVVITFKINLSKFLGRPSILSEDNCRGDISSNPAEQAYFHVFASSADAGTDGGVVNMQVTIDFIVAWTEPHQPTAS
jgi:hypothetical protein